MKYWLLRAGLALSFGILLVTVLKINFIKGSYYRDLALNNKITQTVIIADRGQILDRKGRILAQNVEFDGVKKRQYPYGESVSMITGYVGLVNETELKNGKCGQKMLNQSIVGRGGIEDTMDCELIGTDGLSMMEVDARGKTSRELGQLDPIKGKDINLSIDAFWQENIYKMVSGRKVVVIMSEPNTGKILALVSSPSYDANNFTYSYDRDSIKNYLEDGQNLPMLNRAMGAKYHPGSVFKPIEAAGALEDGIINENSVFEDTGVIKIGDYSFNNWLWTKSHTTDGMVGVVKALKRSIN